MDTYCNEVGSYNPNNYDRIGPVIDLADGEELIGVYGVSGQ